MNLKKSVLVIFTIVITATSFAQIKSSSFGKGINFLAKDSSMSMKFHFRFQNLFHASYDAANESWSAGALVRRSRLKFGGFAFTKNLEYKAEIGLTNRDISVSSEDGNGSGASRLMLDAVLKYKFCKNWTVWFGQTKLPGNRERVISSANLQFVDRSLLNSRFNIDRDVGAQLHGKYTVGENFVIKPKLALTMGEGRDITSGNKGGFNYTGRIEFLPLGEFTKKGDYLGAAVYKEETPKLAVAVTYNFNDGATRQQGQLGRFIYDSTGTSYAMNDLSSIQADLMFRYGGFSLMSEYANTTASDKIDGLSRNYNTGSAFNIQAGMIFKGKNEIAARFTTITPDDVNYSGVAETDEITLGFSRYIVGHSLKFQTDFSMIDIEGVSDPTYRFRFQTEMQF